MCFISSTSWLREGGSHPRFYCEIIFSRKTAQTMMFPTLCLIVRMMFFESHSTFLCLQNMAGGADVKEVKSGFIWLQHFLPILLCKWANLQIVQICVCDMAGEIKSLPQMCVYQADWMKSWLILHCDKEEILPAFPVVVAHLLLPNINPSAQIQACLSLVLSYFWHKCTIESLFLYWGQWLKVFLYLQWKK